MSTEALYVRLPTATKQRLDERAHARGLTIAKAASEVIADGLEFGSERVVQLEHELNVAQQQVATLDRQLATAQSTLNAHQELRATAASRLSTQVGSCPSCQTAVTGSDVFIEGRCPSGHDLQAAVLAPSPRRPGLEANALIGALVVVGVALSVLALTTND